MKASAFDRDLAAWDRGDLRAPELHARHGSERVQAVLEVHHVLENAAAASDHLRPNWGALRVQLRPPRASLRDRFLDRIRRPIVAGFAASVMATSIAGASIAPVREAFASFWEQAVDIFRDDARDVESRMDSSGPRVRSPFSGPHSGITPAGGGRNARNNGKDSNERDGDRRGSRDDADAPGGATRSEDHPTSDESGPPVPRSPDREDEPDDDSGGRERGSGDGDPDDSHEDDDERDRDSDDSHDDDDDADENESDDEDDDHDDDERSEDDAADRDDDDDVDIDEYDPDGP